MPIPLGIWATAGAGVSVNSFIAISSGSSPYINAYSWSSGFGTKYSNPGTLPPGGLYGLSVNKTGTGLAAATHVSPYIVGYTFSASGFGARSTNSSPTYNQESAAFNPAGTTIVVAGDSPRLSAYNWSSGVGGQTSSASLPNGAYDAVFNPLGTQVAAVHGNSPYVSAFPWSPGFGAKYADPATLPPAGGGYGDGVAISPANTSLVMGHSGSPFISGYAWSSSGFGSKYSNPGSYLGAALNEVNFNPTGNLLAATSSNGSPYVAVYDFDSNGFGGRYANPPTTLSGGASDVEFSSNGATIAVSHYSSPYVSVYPWSGGFGAKYADPSTLPNGGYSLAFI